MNIILNYKTLIIRYIIVFIYCFYSSSAKCQIFDSEQNPPTLKWKQIETTNFQIIYPTAFEVEAQRMANTLESIIQSVSNTLNITPKKISIILQNQGTTSNGFVQLAPRRSEFFTTPPQEFDYQDWLNSLAVHELRHVVQFDKLTGNLKPPLFEELALAIFGITLPPWFYEGDAVGIETALTKSGRGRLPSWDLILRTNTLSKKKYPYSKDYFGSQKDNTPGFYQMGYYMTTKLRRDFGAGIMDSIFSRISKNPLLPYSLNSALKKYTGFNSKLLHDATIEELGLMWQKQSEEINPITYVSQNKREDKIPTDYLLPTRISPAQTLFLKQGKSEPPILTIIDTAGKERKVLRIGYQENPHFNFSTGKIVWDEFRFDKRYQKRSYNVINIYDMANKKYKQLTHHSRLFAPCLSPDGNTIAAINISFENKIAVVELNAETGKEIKRYKNPLNLILQTPKYNASGNKIILVGVNQQGNTLCEIDRESGTFKNLIPFQQQQILRPLYAGSQILFSAHYNGINNIYRLDPSTLEIYQLTSSGFGAFNPSFDEQSKLLSFNNYQVYGQDIVSLPYEANLSIKKVPNTFINYAQPLVLQEGNKNVFDSISTKTYLTKPYREISNLFYFHSVRPILEENSLNNDLNFGLQILSTNKLNTLDFYSGYQYNNGLKSSEYFTGFRYKRFYPIIDLQYINRARVAYNIEDINGIPNINAINWRENFTELSTSIPFVFNRLNYVYRTGLTASTSYSTRYNIENQPSNFVDRIRFPMKYQFYANRNSTRSLRDLAPRWGQNIAISFQHFPFENNIQGELFTLKTTLYFPGIFHNHTFQARFNYQEESGNYNLSTEIPQVSGYTHLKRLSPLSNTLLLNYRLPLFYPDLEIGPLAYIKRVRASLFADFENINNHKNTNPKTYGLELTADMNLLRFYFPDFAFGGKFIIVNEKPTQKPIFELAFNYSY